jgi:hypothetical protein
MSCVPQGVKGLDDNDDDDNDNDGETKNNILHS